MASFDSVVDSGERRYFQSGSIRDRADGKGRPALIPVLAMFRLAKHYENGAKKYGDFNWELGQPHSVYADSLYRHLLKYLGGARDEDHLAAIAWNAMAIMQQEEMIERGLLSKDLDDLRVSISKLTGQPINIPRSVFLPQNDPLLDAGSQASKKSDPQILTEKDESKWFPSSC